MNFCKLQTKVLILRTAGSSRSGRRAGAARGSPLFRFRRDKQNPGEGSRAFAGDAACRGAASIRRGGSFAGRNAARSQARRKRALSVSGCFRFPRGLSVGTVLGTVVAAVLVLLVLGILILGLVGLLVSLLHCVSPPPRMGRKFLFPGAAPLSHARAFESRDVLQPSAKIVFADFFSLYEKNIARFLTLAILCAETNFMQTTAKADPPAARGLFRGGPGRDPLERTGRGPKAQARGPFCSRRRIAAQPLCKSPVGGIIIAAHY